MVATLAGGAPIPGSALALKQFQGDAVQDIAALKAVGPGARFDKQERTVEGPPFEQYFFESGSVAASSEPDILVPDDSPAAGRWFRHMPGGGVPGTHAIAGTEHSASTLNAFNAKLSDAVLVDTGDARFSDARTPLAHRASHAGGGDAFLTTDFLEVIVKRLRTTDGPTDMVIGAVADGEFLKRVGSTIVGASAGAAPVDSVFGRVGVVVAVAGDYDSDEVTNVSGVFGSTVTVALNTLDNDKLNLVGDTMTGTLTTQNILPDIAGRNIGATALADTYGTIFVNNIRPGTGLKLLFQSHTGASVFEILADAKINIRQQVVSNTDGTLSFGSGTAPFGTMFANVIQSGTTVNFVSIKPGDGSSGLEIETGKVQIFKNLIADTDNSRTIGEDTRAFAKVVTNIVRPSTTSNLVLQSKDGIAKITLQNGLVQLNEKGRPDANNTLEWGGAAQVWSRVFTAAVRPGTTTTTLLIEDSVGTAVITIPTAGDMTLAPTGNIILNPTGNVVRPAATDDITLGTTTVAFKTIHSRNFQGEDGFAMVIRDGGGNAAFQITQGGTINQFLTQQPGADNTYSLGAAGKVYVKVFTRTLEIGTGTDTAISWSTIQTTTSHAILGLDSVSNIILVTDRDKIASDYNLAVSTTPIMYFADGGVTLTKWTSLTHNGVNFVIRTNFGSTEITSTLLTSQVRARVASSLILSDATGTNVVTIADAGDLNFTPTGDVLIGGIKPVLANGTVSLTAQWNVGDQIISGINALRPDGSSGSKSIGGTGNAWGTVFTRTIRADNTQVLVVADGAATSVITVANAGDLTFSPTGDIITSGDVKPNATGSRSIGTSTLAYVTVFTRGVQSDTASLILRDSGGTSRLEIRTTSMLFRQSLSPFDNGGLDIGNSVDGFGTGFFKFLQASNTFNLIFQDEAGATKMQINATGLGFFTTAPVAKAAVLTTVDATVIDATYGATEEAVINNTRTRLNDLESRLQTYGLLT